MRYDNLLDPIFTLHNSLKPFAGSTVMCLKLGDMCSCMISDHRVRWEEDATGKKTLCGEKKREKRRWKRKVRGVFGVAISHLNLLRKEVIVECVCICCVLYKNAGLREKVKRGCLEENDCRLRICNVVFNKGGLDWKRMSFFSKKKN